MQSEKLRCLARDISELGQQGMASSGHDASDNAEDTVGGFSCLIQELSWNVVYYQRQAQDRHFMLSFIKLVANIIALNNDFG